jgi:hypothetical protein
MTEDFHQLFRYNPWTGVVIRRSTGLPVGGSQLNPNRYLRVTVNHKKYLLHRVIFYMMMRRWPLEVDHRDRNRHNNRWFNLREVTHNLNQQNRGLDKRNIAGCSGVMWKSKRKRWRVQVHHNGVTHFIGYYKEKKLAIQARKEAEARCGYGEAS